MKRIIIFLLFVVIGFYIFNVINSTTNSSNNTSNNTSNISNNNSSNNTSNISNNNTSNSTERFAVSYGINLDTINDKGALYSSRFKPNSGTNFY
jgi:predicted PurR-regulated permease PerM